MKKQQTKITSISKPLSKQQILKNKKAKESYFAYYDDVKHFSKGKEDW